MLDRHRNDEFPLGLHGGHNAAELLVVVSNEDALPRFQTSPKVLLLVV